MKAIICDKCKSVITNEEEIKDVMRLELCNNFVGKFDEKHICKNCKNDFYSFFDEPMK